MATVYNGRTTQERDFYRGIFSGDGDYNNAVRLSRKAEEKRAIGEDPTSEESHAAYRVKMFEARKK